MSYLELAKRVEAGLRGEKPLDAINAVNAKTAPHHFGAALPYLFMPLDEFQTRGCLLEIRVPWLDVTLWFVPSEADAEALAREGVSRGRVWTANELINLMSISDETSGMVRTLAHAKLTMAGEIFEVRTR